MSVDKAAWIFQTDSDNEIAPEYFRELWALREHYDALFGTRRNRKQTAGRAAISFVSRLIATLLFGKGVVDVNTPFRLMRSELLRGVISRIPADTYAPNIIIAGEFAATGASICNYPVCHAERTTGVSSIVKWKLCVAAFRSFLQIVRYRLNRSGNSF